MEELEAGLNEIRRSPKDGGVVQLIVRRPETEQREVLDEGVLNPQEGLEGDCWKARGSSRTADGSPHPDAQVTVMNSRVIALVAQDKDRWQQTGL